MKAYTDLEQSKKLAEILQHITADNTWERVTIPGSNVDVPEEQQYVHRDVPFTYFSGIGVPCWSLAALLEQIPVTAEYKDMFIRLRIDKGNVGHDEYAIWYDDLQTNLSTDIETEADNFVDACVDMIAKLHEQKLL